MTLGDYLIAEAYTDWNCNTILCVFFLLSKPFLKSERKIPEFLVIGEMQWTDISECLLSNGFVFGRTWRGTGYL